MDWEVDDEQIMGMLASPLCIQGRKARQVQTPSRMFHSNGSSWKYEQKGAAQGEQETLSKLSEAEYHTRALLEEQRHQLLSEAKSEIRKQWSRAELADLAMCETNRGHAWLHTELEDRESVLREVVSELLKKRKN